jgi:hypothetical protein
VGGSTTCSAICAFPQLAQQGKLRKIAADVRFEPQSADCGISLAHQEIKLRTLLPLCTILFNNYVPLLFIKEKERGRETALAVIAINLTTTGI